MPTDFTPGRRVLFVDDHEASLVAVANYLGAGRAWRVRTARTESEALTLVSSRPFDVFLIDLCLDGASPDGGLRVAERARSLRRSARIVILSGQSPTPDVVERIRKVADVFLTKPLPLRSVELALAGERVS